MSYIYNRKVSTTTAYTLNLAGITSISYQSDTAPAAKNETVAPQWELKFSVPYGLSVVPNDIALSWAGANYFARSGQVFRNWSPVTGAMSTVGAVSDDGRLTLGANPTGTGVNSVSVLNAAYDKAGGLDVYQGVFRVPSAPIQANPFQLRAGAEVGSSNSGGILSGDFTGEVDSLRGTVKWAVSGLGPGAGEGTPVRADEVTYNAIFLQYVPLDSDLLGVDTAGLPADGRVPIYRSGGHVVVHNTQVLALPNPLTKGTAYSLGRARLASVVVRDTAGTRLPGTLYDVDRNAGTVTIKVSADISTYAQPLSVEHRVQDELQVLSADISGKLLLAGALSHNYPLGSYVSSKLRQGDRFARVFGYADRATWQNSWDATLAGQDIGAASFNSIDHPITTTNRGAITERWAAIFVNSTTVRVVGEKVGQVLSSAPIAAAIEAINPQTGAPYWSIPAAAWGGGWPVGGVLLWETQAAGGPAWFARSVQPGGTEVLDDSAVFGYIANVDTP